MASNKKGQYAVTREWAKHLRKVGKKFFWSSERIQSKNAIKSDKEI